MASHTRIRIDVGGKMFATNLETVTKHKAAGSHLSRLFDNDPIYIDPASGTCEYFIDRDPRSFGHILQWLRDQRTVIVNNDSEKDRLLSECLWYGPFVGGDPIVLTDAEYRHNKVFGDSSFPGLAHHNFAPPAGCYHAKQKFYSLQLR